MGVLKIQSAFDELSDRQKMFVVEYIVDLNGMRAAKEAGYKGNHSTTAGKLLKNPKVAKAIQEALKPTMDKLELTKESVLKQLTYFLFRDIAEFMDDDGYLLCSPRKLPPQARQCIESWESYKEYDEDGNVVGERWKVKCVSKAASLDLAMKYLKLTGPELQQNNVTVNFWDSFFKRANEAPPPSVETIIEGVLANGSTGNNGTGSNALGEASIPERAGESTT